MAYDLSALGSGLGGEGNVGLQETEGWVLERRGGLIREEGIELVDKESVYYKYFVSARAAAGVPDKGRAGRETGHREPQESLKAWLGVLHSHLDVWTKYIELHAQVCTASLA